MPLLDNLIGFAKLRLEPVQNRLNRGVFRYPPTWGITSVISISLFILGIRKLAKKSQSCGH